MCKEAKSMLLEATSTAVPVGEPDGPGERPCSAAEETLLALTLITTWALTTGRALPRDVPVHQLSADELIQFWADPFSMEARP
jgi:hypothetical protein